MVVKSRRIRWTGHVERMEVVKSRKIRGAGHVERMEKDLKFWSENLKVRDHSEGPDVHGRIILEWM
jgi:hypothetical protein